MHNFGAFQSVEMREMREDEEESATDCWLGGRVGGPIRWRKPVGGEGCVARRALLMGE